MSWLRVSPPIRRHRRQHRAHRRCGSPMVTLTHPAERSLRRNSCVLRVANFRTPPQDIDRVAKPGNAGADTTLRRYRRIPSRRRYPTQRRTGRGRLLTRRSQSGCLSMPGPLSLFRRQNAFVLYRLVMSLSLNRIQEMYHPVTPHRRSPHVVTDNPSTSALSRLGTISSSPYSRKTQNGYPGSTDRQPDAATPPWLTFGTDYEPPANSDELCTRYFTCPPTHTARDHRTPSAPTTRIYRPASECASIPRPIYYGVPNEAALYFVCRKHH